MNVELTDEKRIAYTQVLEVLRNMNEEDIKKVPEKIIELFNRNCAKNYEFKINPVISLKELGLNNYALSLLAMLQINYWCKSDDEKIALADKFSENERKDQEELRIKYNPDNLFKKNKQEIMQEENVVEKKEQKIIPEENILEKKENSLPAKIPWYKSLIQKIKEIFKKKS